MHIIDTFMSMYICVAICICRTKVYTAGKHSTCSFRANSFLRLCEAFPCSNCSAATTVQGSLIWSEVILDQKIELLTCNCWSLTWLESGTKTRVCRENSTPTLRHQSVSCCVHAPVWQDQTAIARAAGLNCCSRKNGRRISTRTIT